MYEIVPSELKVLQPRPGMAVVEVLGEHDLATRDEDATLFARLIAENEFIVVDLSEAMFIDSSFLNNLIQAKRAATSRGSTLLLQVGTEPIVERMLEVSHFLTHFDHARRGKRRRRGRLADR